MNKQELIAAVAEQTGESTTAVTAILDGITGVIRDTVADGGKVAIRDFGAFERSYRAARPGRNPQTGESIQIDESWGAKFTAYDGFKSAVHGRARAQGSPSSAAA
ncbi:MULTISPECIES: HU family DNA-binding protein [unclassified Nonomuraea]|uniref:HU family DNA-binding protein n=1 Tax=unclassified Nonomuraea TaxID=2593643 RepID=UPI003401DC7F